LSYNVFLVVSLLKQYFLFLIWTRKSFHCFNSHTSTYSLHMHVYRCILNKILRLSMRHSTPLNTCNTWKVSASLLSESVLQCREHLKRGRSSRCREQGKSRRGVSKLGSMNRWIIEADIRGSSNRAMKRIIRASRWGKIFRTNYYPINAFSAFLLWRSTKRVSIWKNNEKYIFFYRILLIIVSCE